MPSSNPLPAVRWGALQQGDNKMAGKSLACSDYERTQSKADRTQSKADGVQQQRRSEPWKQVRGTLWLSVRWAPLRFRGLLESG